MSTSAISFPTDGVYAAHLTIPHNLGNGPTTATTHGGLPIKVRSWKH